MNALEIKNRFSHNQNSPLSEKDFSKDYINLKYETLNYLNEVEKTDFPIFFYVDNTLYQVMPAGKPNSEIIEDLINTRSRSETRSAVCVKRQDYASYEAIMTTIRQKKIELMIANQGQLSSVVLELFSKLCSASQPLEQGHLSLDCMNRIYEYTDQIAKNYSPTANGISTISHMISNDPSLYDHGASVALMCAIFARTALNKSENETAVLMRCGLFHDIGKAFIPAAVLHKPGSLTNEEFRLVKTHTLRGANELELFTKSFPGLEPEIIAVALEHHEKYHGHGYPNGKSGRLEEQERGIHEYARIILIIDIFNALLMKQDYREAYSPSKALQIMGEDAERDYDPIIWQKFKTFIEASIEAEEDSIPYVQRSGRFSVQDLIKKRMGIKSAS